MANVNNFGLVGIGQNVQFGKAGSSIITATTPGVFSFQTAASADAAITTAGITSSGNLSLTSGNVSFNGDTLGASSGVFTFSGTGAIVVPAGTTLEEPTAVAGGFRYNTTNSTMEYSTGTGWTTLATGGAAVTTITINSTNGFSGTSSGGPTPALTLSTTASGLLAGHSGSLATATSGTDIKTVGGNSLVGAGDVPVVTSIAGTANQITASAATGAVTLSVPSAFIAPGSVEVSSTLTVNSNTPRSFLYSDTSSNVVSTAAPINGEILIGSTGASPVKSTITAGTGVSVANGAGTITIGNTGVTSVTVASSTTPGLTVSNPTVTTTGTISLALSSELVGVDALSSAAQTGFVVRTGAGTYTSSAAITGTAGDIIVTNGNGVAGNPTIDLAPVTQGSTGNFNKFAVDGFGRVVSNTAVTQGDITGVLGTYYLPEAGGIMSGSIAMGGNSITSLASPVASTDAANKSYVDAAVAGLTWKTAVQVATTVAGTLATSFAAGQVIDGYTLLAGDRILIKNQVTGTENGIYIVQASGAPVRSSDMAVGASAVNDAMFVENGTTNANSGWVETADPAVVGTNALVFTQFSGAGSYTAGNGLTLTGNQFSLKSPVTIANGGTGQSTASAAFNALSPITATGDLIVGNGVNSATNLSIGTTGQVLTVTGGTAAWGTNAFTIDVDGAGTGSVALGSTLAILGATNRIHTTISSETITVDIDANYVGQTSITTLGTIATGTWAGTTIAANYGGTGQTAYSVGDILYADTTNTLAKLSDVAAGSYLRSGGVSTAPVWSTTTLPNSATTGDLMYASGANTYANLADVAVGSVLLSGGVGVAPSYGKVDLTAAVTNVLPTANGGTGLATFTADGVFYASNAATVSQLVLADGQLIIGSSSGAPVAATLTGGSGITISNASGSITISSTAGAGAVGTVSATISLASTGSFNIGAALPAGATVLSVKVNVTAVDTATGTFQVGTSGNGAYMSTSENDTQATGIYVAECMVSAGGAQVQGTVGGTPGGSGSVTVFVTYAV